MNIVKTEIKKVETTVSIKFDSYNSIEIKFPFEEKFITDDMIVNVVVDKIKEVKYWKETNDFDLYESARCEKCGANGHLVCRFYSVYANLIDEEIRKALINDTEDKTAIRKLVISLLK